MWSATASSLLRAAGAAQSGNIWWPDTTVTESHARYWVGHPSYASVKGQAEAQPHALLPAAAVGAGYVPPTAAWHADAAPPPTHPACACACA
jgi:hypothetical protein